YDPFSIQWIGYWKRNKPPFKQHATQSALIFARQRNRRLFSAGHGLKPRIVEIDLLPLAAFHHKERRPFLVEAAAFAIHEPAYRLDLRIERRTPARQRLRQSEHARRYLGHQGDVECHAPDVIDVR